MAQPCGGVVCAARPVRTRMMPSEMSRLTTELENFHELASSLLPTPGDVPAVDGVDIFGGTLPLSGSLGGDLIVYIDFKRLFDIDARIDQAIQQRSEEHTSELQSQSNLVCRL